MAVIQGGGITYDQSNRASQMGGQFASLAQNLAQLRQQAQQFDKEFALNQQRLQESTRQFDESVRQFGITEQRMAEGLKIQKQAQALGTVQQQMVLAKEFAGRLGARNFLGSKEGEGLLRNIAEQMAIAQGVEATPETIEKYITDVTVSINAWTDPTVKALVALGGDYDVSVAPQAETPGATGAAATPTQAKTATDIPDTKMMSYQEAAKAAREAGGAAPKPEPAETIERGRLSLADGAPVDKLTQFYLDNASPDDAARIMRMSPDDRARWIRGWLDSTPGALKAWSDFIQQSEARGPITPANVADPTLVQAAMQQPTATNITTANAEPGSAAGKAATVAAIQQGQLGPQAPLTPAPNAARPIIAGQQSKETAYFIARNNRAPTTAMEAFNFARVNANDFNNFVPGAEPAQQPQAAPGVSKPGAPTTYKVESGDTLGNIAKKYGVSLKSVIDTNKLANPEFNPDVIRPGQEIKIPGQPTTMAGQAVGVVSKAIAGTSDLMKIQKIMDTRGVTPDQIVDSELDVKKATTVQEAAAPVFKQAAETLMTAFNNPEDRVAQMKAQREAARAGSWVEKVFKTATPSQKAKIASDIMVELENMPPEAIALKYGTDIAGVRLAKDEQTIAAQNALLSALAKQTKDGSLDDLRQLYNDLSNSYNRVRDNVFGVYQNEVQSKDRGRITFDTWISDPKNKIYGDEYTKAYNRLAQVEGKLFGGEAAQMVVEQSTKGSWFGIGGKKGGIRYTAGGTVQSGGQTQGSKAATDWVNSVTK